MKKVIKQFDKSTLNITLNLIWGDNDGVSYSISPNRSVIFSIAIPVKEPESP
jgi:hypothetical protein